jgi:hypothetical protein
MIEDALENVTITGNFSGIVAIASYVFCALALYTIAQRREIKKAWLAWVPVLNVWILGSISDQYRYVVKGEIRSRRKVLLTLNIINFVLGWVAVIKMIVTIVMLAIGRIDLNNEMEVIRQVLISAAFFIPGAILGIVALIFRIIALYDVYTSCDPANNVLYLVLSLIPGINQVTQPLFLFLCRDKDEGMPPRRQSSEAYQEPVDCHYDQM